MGVSYSCMKYGVFITIWSEAIQICIQHCEPVAAKITFLTNFCLGVELVKMQYVSLEGHLSGF